MMKATNVYVQVYVFPCVYIHVFLDERVMDVLRVMGGLRVMGE